MRSAHAFGEQDMKKFFLVLAGAVALAGSATAADLPARTYAKVPATAPVSNWTGCYIGANVGAGSNRETFTNVNPRRLPNFDLGSEQATGAMGGGQIGCDYQVGNWVFGAQGAFDATDFKGSNHVVPGPNDWQFPNVFDLSSRISWITTATARLGYAIQPQVLLYARGGAAWMHSSLDYTITGMGIANFTGAETRAGWVIGGGLEYLIAPNWSVFAEYSHMDFGNSTLNTQDVVIANNSPEPILIGQRIDTVMLGLNYRFGSSQR
jgi:outer membrane immunogenic protein